jgi:hypothetical protein
MDGFVIVVYGSRELHMLIRLFFGVLEKDLNQMINKRNFFRGSCFNGSCREISFKEIS